MKLGLIVMAFALVGGCSKKEGSNEGGGDAKVASCHSESMKSCREYRGAYLSMGTESIAELCTIVDSGAKFTEAACSTAKVIGTCKTPEHKDFYYEGHVLADTMEKSCTESGGTFAK